jgi:hypothetical protein
MDDSDEWSYLKQVFETIVFVMQTKGGLCKSMEFE